MTFLRLWLAACCIGLALQVGFPPWRALAVLTEERTKDLDRQDLALMLQGVEIGKPAVTSDTFTWAFRGVPVWETPSLERQAWASTLDSIGASLQTREAKQIDSVAIAALIEASTSAEDRFRQLEQRYRVPFPLRVPETARDSSGSSRYFITRQKRYYFSIDYPRMALQVALLLFATGAVALIALAYRHHSLRGALPPSAGDHPPSEA